MANIGIIYLDIWERVMKIVVKRDCRVLTAKGRSRRLTHFPVKFIAAGDTVEVADPVLLPFNGTKVTALKILSRGLRFGGYILKEEAETLSEQGKLTLAAHGPP